MYEYKFPMAGVTATMVLFHGKTGEVLLGLRGKNSDAYPNCWSLPGGFLNVGVEELVTAARRETEEETSLIIAEDRWSLFYNDDAVGTDPRYVQVINLCYWVEVSEQEYNAVKASDDLDEVIWVKLEEALAYELAFAHNQILREFAKTAK